MSERISFMDLLIQTLMEHEKALDEKISELDDILREMRVIEGNMRRLAKRGAKRF